MLTCPKVTIITACFNSEESIEHTITSVAKQTYKNIEYIIVDGGSTDTTLNIIKNYEEHIAKLISEPDQGIFDAFNKGVANASGDIIYFLNSDDFLYDETVIESVIKVFQEDETIQFVYGNIEIVNKINGYFDLVGRSVDLSDIKQGVIPPHSGSFAKRELFSQYNGFDLKYKIGSDTDFIVKVFKDYADQCKYMNKIIARFTLGGVSSKGDNRKKALDEINYILLDHFGIIVDHQKSLTNTNMKFYKRWIEVLLTSNKGISNCLKQCNITNVAIFGTREIALLLHEDLRKSNINTISFLDNNHFRQGKDILDVAIHPPTWLLQNMNSIDAVILAFEGDYEEEVKTQIEDIIKPAKLKVITWKELILLNPNNTIF